MSTSEHETWTVLPPQSLAAVIDDDLHDREVPDPLAPVARTGETVPTPAATPTEVPAAEAPAEVSAETGGEAAAERSAEEPAHASGGGP